MELGRAQYNTYQEHGPPVRNKGAVIRKDLPESDKHDPSDVHMHPTQIPKRQES